MAYLVTKTMAVLGLARGERGQDLIEYSLLSGLVAASLILAAVLFTGALDSMMQGIGNCIDFSGATDCL